MDIETPFTEQSTSRRTTTERREWPSLAGRSHWISWSAVFAGIITGAAVETMLGLLGIGVGARTISPTQATNPFSGLDVQALAWLFGSTLISYFAAGWFAGRCAGLLSRANGALHGIVTWAASMVAIVLVLSGIPGGAASGPIDLLGSTLQTARAFGRPPVNQTVDTASSPVATAMPDDTNVTEPSTKEQLTEGQTPAEPQPQPTQISRTNQTQTQQSARATEEKAAKVSTATAFMGFTLLLLAAIAAGLGGAASVKSRRVVRSQPFFG